VRLKYKKINENAQDCAKIHAFSYENGTKEHKKHTGIHAFSYENGIDQHTHFI
jgi:hypothetical protein